MESRKAPSAFGSICVTFRPKNGMNNKLEHAIIQYCKKQDFAIVVSEMENEARHLHIQFWFLKPRELGTVRRWAIRTQSEHDPNWDESSKNVLIGKVGKSGITHAYNDDFYTKYLDKGGSVLYKVIPSDTKSFYPSVEYQEKAIAIHHAADKKFCKLAFEFDSWRKTQKQYPPKFTFMLVCQYLSYRMYDARDMYVVTNKRKKEELAENLYWYIKGSDETSVLAFVNTGQKHCSPITDKVDINKIVIDTIENVVEDVYFHNYQNKLTSKK